MTAPKASTFPGNYTAVGLLEYKRGRTQTAETAAKPLHILQLYHSLTHLNTSRGHFFIIWVVPKTLTKKKMKKKMMVVVVVVIQPRWVVLVSVDPRRWGSKRSSTGRPGSRSPPGRRRWLGPSRPPPPWAPGCAATGS